MKEALRAVKNPRSTSHKLLLNEFFGTVIHPALRLMYDDMHSTNLERKLDSDLNLEQYVKDIGGIGRQDGESRLGSLENLRVKKWWLQRLEASFWLRPAVTRKMQSVFERYGAVEFDTALLRPSSSATSDKNSTTSTLLDENGVVVQLPSNLCHGWARYVALNHPNIVLRENIRRYSFDRVYRKQQRGVRAPKELHEAEFDIVWPLYITNEEKEDTNEEAVRMACALEAECMIATVESLTYV